MNDLLVGLLSAVLSTNQPTVVSNLLLKTTGVSVHVPDPNDPVEKEFQQLLEADDAAQAEVDEWIVAERTRAERDGGHTNSAPEMMRLRIEQRFAPVKRAYEDFLLRHGDHARTRLAYGSFLNDIGEEAEAVKQWEKARDLEPTNPAAWNNLGNYYGHRGPVEKAFPCYEKALELAPNEAVYYQNLATVVYVYRTDAKAYYHQDEDAVLERAMQLYRQAVKLDPKNFPLATDYAQSYYGFRSPATPEAQAKRREDALAAWNYALGIAGDDIEREGVRLHLARIEIKAGNLEAAQRHLEAVTNAMYTTMKQRLERNLNQKRPGASQTNAPAAEKPSSSARPSSPVNASP